MVARMCHGGHGWRSSNEMTAAMCVPALALAVYYWLGGVSASSVCGLACAVIIPLMVLAMLYRLVMTRSVLCLTRDQRFR